MDIARARFGFQGSLEPAAREGSYIEVAYAFLKSQYSMAARVSYFSLGLTTTFARELFFSLEFGYVFFVTTLSVLSSWKFDELFGWI